MKNISKNGNSKHAESWSLAEILSFADRECIDLWENLRLSYSEIKGLPLLRTEIAKLYDGCTDGNILCLAGAEEGILCAATALLTSGDHTIVVRPCYQSLFELPKHTGADVSAINLSHGESWELDLEKVRAAIRHNTKILWINYPHNPTGTRLCTEQLHALIAIAREHNIILFSDEVYRLLDAGETKPEPPVASIYERGISLGVMSKAYGLAGLRIGWLASQDKELLKKIERVKYYSSICNSAPAEILSLIALRAREQILGRNNTILRDNLAMLDQFFKEYETQFSWVRPKGGCIAFPNYRGAEGIDQFSAELVATKGVLLLPGRVYDWTGNHFRLGFGRKNMPEALIRLKQFVDGRPRRR